MSPEDGIAKMCRLLDEYGAAMHVDGVNTTRIARDPAKARDVAFDMLQVLNRLYHVAYVAAAEQARRQGKTL